MALPRCLSLYVLCRTEKCNVATQGKTRPVVVPIFTQCGYGLGSQRMLTLFLVFGLVFGEHEVPYSPIARA